MSGYSPREQGVVLRRELHAAFPATKFAARMERGTAYGWYTVAWTDGPCVADVEAVIASVDARVGFYEFPLTQRAYTAEVRAAAERDAIAHGYAEGWEATARASRVLTETTCPEAC